MSIGKLEMRLSLEDLLSEISNSDLNVMQIEDGYLMHISKLPLLHKDPFDRLIISTALAEDLTIITIDENIQKYNVSWIW
jgi:PIN domain nuclease of toxin-antitoxin system